MRYRIPMLAAAVATMLALTAGSALAMGTLDQDQTAFGSVYVQNGSEALGQTFVAGISGTLDTVQVYTSWVPQIQLPVQPSLGGMTIQITTTSGSPALPTGTVLATQVLGPSDILNGDWSTATFTTPTTVVAGTAYAIVIVPTLPAEWDGHCGSVNYGPGRGYVLDGSSWVTVGAFATAHSLNAGTYCQTEFAFKTYVTAPAPTASPTLAPTVAPTVAPTPPPTNTGGSNSGDSPSNLSYLLLFGGIAAAAVVAAFASNTRRRLIRR
jgi:hypothetical protein